MVMLVLGDFSTLTFFFVPAAAVTAALLEVLFVAATSNCNFVRFLASECFVDWAVSDPAAAAVVDDDDFVEGTGSRTVGRVHFVGMPDFLLLLLLLLCCSC